MMRCRDCKYYEYKGELEKGHCSWYGAYYWPDDLCVHGVEGDGEEEEE